MMGVSAISNPVSSSYYTNNTARKSVSSEEASESATEKSREAQTGEENVKSAPRSSPSTSTVGQLLNIVA